MNNTNFSESTTVTHVLGSGDGNGARRRSWLGSDTKGLPEFGFSHRQPQSASNDRETHQHYLEENTR